MTFIVRPYFFSLSSTNANKTTILYFNSMRKLKDYFYYKLHRKLTSHESDLLNEDDFIEFEADGLIIHKLYFTEVKND